MKDDIKALKADHSETIYRHYFPAWTGNGKKITCFSREHEDKNPSLSIFQKDGEHRHKCQACGVSGDCLDLIGQLENIPDTGHRIGRLKEIAGISGKAGTQRKVDRRSLSLADIQKIIIDGKFKFERYHTYDAGKPPYIRVLFKDAAGAKTGRYFTPVAENVYIPGRKSKPVLYNQEMLSQEGRGEVCFPEGEKDCNTLSKLGFCSVTNGSANDPLTPEILEPLRGFAVLIFQDNDIPGREAALKKAEALQGIAESVKVIELPGLPEKGDVSDWIQARQAEGKTVNAELRAIVKGTPEWEGPKEMDIVSLLPTLSDLAAMDLTVDYVLEGIIPEKAITVLYGRGGRGKTTLMLQAGYCIAEGLPFEGLTTKQMPVIYCDWDNPLNVICDKAKRLGSSLNFHYWHNAFNEPKLSKLDKAEWEIFKKLPNNALLIFDTLKSCQGLDMNKDDTMAFVLERFRELRDLGFTIVILHHTPRGEERPKNNTTITDNSDHCIGIVSAKGEAGEENKDDLLFFGCGEADKSRYAKHHIYMTFDGEVFERAQDPEDSKFEGMRNLIETLIKEGIRPNQSKITEAAKDRLNLNPPKARDILNRGEGKHWKSTRIKAERNQKVYELIQFSSFQTLYSEKTEKLPENQFSDPSKTETLQTLDAVEFSSFSDPSKKTEKLPENQFSGESVFQDTFLKTEPAFIDAEVE